MPESLARLLDVTSEIATLLGPGTVTGEEVPLACAAFVIAVEHPARLSVLAQLDLRTMEPLGSGSFLLAVGRTALERLFGWSAEAWDGQSFYLDDGQIAIARSLFDERDCGGATTTYRLAKSMELLCELVGSLKRGSLIPLPSEALLSRQDLACVTLARRIIDEQWSEKLTIDQLARSCGLNRSKLTKGFRDVYRTSISEALAERRLAEAQRQLLGTDLPVGVIGYRSGYLNNASFTRAFGRRFGVSPSDYRSARAA